MKKKFIVLFVMAMAFSSLSACSMPEEEPDLGRDIVDGVVESLGSIKTYWFNADATQAITSETGSEPDQEVVTTDIRTGAFDLENKKMEISITRIGENELKSITQLYLSGDTLYMRGEIPGKGSRWFELEAPAWYWEQVNQLKYQVELLKAAGVDITGSETVVGIDCYVLELTLDTDQLWQIFMSQDLTAPAAELTRAEEAFREAAKVYSAKYWVARDTYLIIKTEVEAAYTFPAAISGIYGEDEIIEMNISVTCLFYDYDQPVSIVLPPQA